MRAVSIMLEFVGRQHTHATLLLQVILLLKTNKKKKKTLKGRDKFNVDNWLHVLWNN